MRHGARRTMPRLLPPAVLLLSVLACDSHPTTQVVVYFHATASLRAEGAAISVLVEGPDGEVAYDETNPPSVGVGPIARVPLVPRDGDAGRVFRIAGALLDGEGQELGSVEAVAGYVEDELREIHLWFDESCRGVPDCGRGRTCNRGVCVGACFDTAPPGAVTRSEPACGECQECLAASCAPLEDGLPCGCPSTDQCNAGACVTSKPVAEVYGGHVHTCASTRDRQVWCWGSDRVGQLGTGGSAAPTPQAVELSSSSTGAAATDHTCWLTQAGERRCWGWNGNGQLGLGHVDGSPFETPVAGPEGEPDWASMDTGWYFTCALTRDGRVFCWGSNDRGQVGVPTDVEDPVPSPTQVGDGSDWASVAAAGFHACGIRNGGTLWCWGMNDSGELGIGITANQVDPVQTGCADGRCFDDWISVGLGDFHTCAIREGGDLWCWGGNLNGQLGVGTVMERDSSRPMKVGGSGWRVVEGGGSHTCGIRDDGSLWCWGRNDRGQLGLPELTRHDVPARVHAPGGDEWIRLGLGREHTCAIRSDETLWCWGFNEDGQLGIGGGEAIVAAPSRVCFP